MYRISMFTYFRIHLVSFVDHIIQSVFFQYKQKSHFTSLILCLRQRFVKFSRLIMTYLLWKTVHKSFSGGVVFWASPKQIFKNLAFNRCNHHAILFSWHLKYRETIFFLHDAGTTSYVVWIWDIDPEKK